MTKIVFGVLTCHPKAVIPRFQTAGAAGADVHAIVEPNEDGEELFVLAPGKRVTLATGLRFDIPAGYEIQVRSRSGLAHKWGVVILNQPGTLDSDYRGELKAMLINLGEEPFPIKTGDRVAQLVPAAVAPAAFEPVTRLSDTARGQGGFGSTGLR